MGTIPLLLVQEQPLTKHVLHVHMMELMLNLTVYIATKQLEYVANARMDIIADGQQLHIKINVGHVPQVAFHA